MLTDSLTEWLWKYIINISNKLSDLYASDIWDNDSTSTVDIVKYKGNFILLSENFTAINSTVPLYRGYIFVKILTIDTH